MSKKNQRILAAAFLAGLVSIVYELVWTRYLGLILGNSVYAVGVVTACYMTGMALGDFVIGTWTVRHYSRARAAAFAGLAACCVLSPGIYRLMVWVNQLGAGLAAQAGAGQLLWRTAVSFLVLLIPTGFIGGVLPVLIAVSDGHDGTVYAVNTLGSVVGAVLTGFLMIPEVGLAGSMGLAGALMAVSYFLIGKGEKQGKTLNLAERTKDRSRRSYSKKAGLLALAVYGISGFTGMAFQVYQTRILTLFFMDSVYDFAVILAIYLTGLFIGNALSSVWARRTSLHMEILAGTQIFLGVCSVFSLYLVNQLPYWTDGVTSQSGLYEQFGGNYFIMGLLLKAGYTGLLLLIPAVLWGMAYPMVSRICMSAFSDDGRTAGIILGWNTVGSAAGSMMASFVLIGLLGVQRAVMMNGCLNLTGGVFLLLAAEGWVKKRRMMTAGGGILLSAAVLAGVPEWNRFEMSTSFLKPGQDVEGYVDIRYYKEDEYGITSVVEFLPYNETYLTTNRLYCQNTSNMTGAEDHRRLSYIPLMLHPSPKRVLVEGLGAGVTLRGAAEYGDLKIDCVEISGAVAEAAEEFREENNHVLDSEQVNLVIDDARNFLLTGDDLYDVIIADIFFPMSSGSGNMFSREYYESCLDRLSQNGLMAQWIPLHQFSSEELAITMKTFSSVFPNTTVWFGMIGQSVPVAGLIGSRNPLEISFDRIAGFYDGSQAHQMDLRNTALDDPYMFLSHFVKLVDSDAFAEAIPYNTDNRPILEYLNPAGAQSYRERGTGNVRALLDAKQSPAAMIDFGSGGSEEILNIYEQEIREFIQITMQQ